MVLEREGTAAAAKGRIRRDTPPGMCTGQTRERGLQHHVTELHSLTTDASAVI